MKGLTPRQKAVLDIISRTLADRGYPPTIREIGQRLGIRSTNGVNDHLKALERKGYLARDKSKSRAIRVGGDPANDDGMSLDPPLSDDLIAVPLLGRIAAGAPILAEENREATFHIDAGLLGSRARQNQVFILKVRGDSMIEAGIMDGDLIFVERTSEVRQGEIVAALLDGEATVKRWYRRGDTIRLEPANAALSPIFISKEEGRDFSICGRVIGVFRQV